MSNNTTLNWAPSEKLRLWMLWGAVALGVDICLCAASLAIEVSRAEEPDGVSVTDVLDGSIVIPQFVVLCAFLALAREVDSFSLWRSSIGVFGCLWLLAPLMYTSDEGWHWWDTALSLAVVAGAVCVIVFVIRRPAVFSADDSADNPVVDRQTETPADEDPRREEIADNEAGSRAGCGWGSAIAAAVTLKVAARALRNVNADWMEILLVLLAVLLLICLAVFSIWFGMVKIRLRDRLGTLAAVCGAVDILSVLLYLATMAYVSLVIVQLAVKEQEPDFQSPQLLIPIAAISLFDILWKVLMAALFLSIRVRGRAAWDDEFNAMDRYIDRR